MHNLGINSIPDLGCSDRKSTLTSLKTAILGTAVLSRKLAHNLEADLIPDLGCSDRKSTLTSLKTAILGTAVSYFHLVMLVLGLIDVHSRCCRESWCII